MYKAHAVVLSVFLLLATPAEAVLCPEPQAKPESPAAYLAALTSSFGVVKSGRDKFAKATEALDGPSAGTDALVALKIARENYDCARQTFLPYRKSKNENIAKSAIGFVTSLEKLDGALLANEKKVKDILNGKPSKLSPGEKAEREANDILAGNKAWELFLLSTAMATHAMIKENVSDEKGPAQLAITKKEKEEACQVLKDEFELPLKKQESYFPLEVAASTVFKFLNQDWKFKE